MKSTTVAWLACALLVAVTAAPAPEPAPAPAAAPEPAPAPSADDRPEIIEIIAPAASAQETLASLNLGEPGSELSERNKRTIGILRQLFPALTQIIEQKVQTITSTIFQTISRALLGGASGRGEGTVTFDDDADDGSGDGRVLVELPTYAPDAEPLPNSPPLGPASNDYNKSVHKRSVGVAAEENQLLAGAESQQQEVRVQFAGEDQQAAASEDQQTAAQTNTATIDEISLDDADGSDENRNKRFLNFGFGGGAGAAAGGGGSGNFIFDIVRLAAGSSATEPQEDGGASGVGVADGTPKGDGLTEGVPGPITRLFIIANRGIANLIQDLILRIAQTSERIVNFKARLITSII